MVLGRLAVAAVWASVTAAFSTAVIATAAWLRWFRATSPYCETGTCSGSIDGIALDRLWSEGAAALEAAGAPAFTSVGLTLPLAAWAVWPLLAPRPPRALLTVVRVVVTLVAVAVAAVLLDLGGFAWLSDVTE